MSRVSGNILECLELLPDGVFVARDISNLPPGAIKKLHYRAYIRSVGTRYINRHCCTLWTLTDIGRRRRNEARHD